MHYTRSSPAAGNIHVLLFPAQCRLWVTMDLTPELYTLVNQDHLVHRPLHKHWSFCMWKIHIKMLNILLTVINTVCYCLVNTLKKKSHALLLFEPGKEYSIGQTSYQTLRAELFHFLSLQPCWPPHTHMSLYQSSWYLRSSAFLHEPVKKK